MMASNTTHIEIYHHSSLMVKYPYNSWITVKIWITVILCAYLLSNHQVNINTIIVIIRLILWLRIIHSIVRNQMEVWTPVYIVIVSLELACGDLFGHHIWYISLCFDNMAQSIGVSILFNNMAWNYNMFLRKVWSRILHI